MSYLTSNAVLASGLTTLTVPAGGALTSTNVALTGIDKTTDSVIITLNINAVSVTAETHPYVLAVTSGTGFAVAMNLINGTGGNLDCILSWAVLR